MATLHLDTEECTLLAAVLNDAAAMAAENAEELRLDGEDDTADDLDEMADRLSLLYAKVKEAQRNGY